MISSNSLTGSAPNGTAGEAYNHFARVRAASEGKESLSPLVLSPIWPTTSLYVTFPDSVAASGVVGLIVEQYKSGSTIYSSYSSTYFVDGQ